MKLGDILLKAGSAVLTTVFPPAAAVIDLVNSFLPDDKKLPAAATGEQVKKTIETELTGEQRAELMHRDFDVQIEEIRTWRDIQEALAVADAAGASTRPKIALMMAWLVVVTGAVFTAAWSWAILRQNTETLKAVAEAWPLLLAALGTPTALLRAYFGMRTEEKKARYSVATEQPLPATGLLADVAKAWRR